MVLNAHLGNNNFVVGDSVTYADLALWFNLKPFFQLSFLENMRKNAFPNVSRWFTTLASHENIVKVAGKVTLCGQVQKPIKPPKEEKKKPVEAPKKEVKEGEEEGEEGQEKKKPKSKLDLLPPTTLDLETFKREYMNSKDKKATLEKFWSTFDSKGWSFWFLQYQNLPTEGKILFKTKNSASTFLQKLDNFRKYSFGVYGVYGVENDYVCRGILMWRGLEECDEVFIV